MNMERHNTPKPQVLLFPGLLKRDMDDWCETCQKTTIWKGPVWAVSADALDYWGTTEGCGECNKWIWRNKKGLIVQIDVIKSPKGLE